MLLKYFNGNKLSVFIVIPLLMALCWLPVFVSSDLQLQAETASWSFLGGYLVTLNLSYPFIAAILAMLVIMGSGFLMLQLNTAHIFIAARTQMPALLYMLLCSAFAGHVILEPALISSFLIILMLFRVLAAYKKESLSYNFLDAGILVSLASLFYFPAILFYPVLLIMLYIIRPNIWREWIFTLIGLALPYLFIMAGFYLTDKDTTKFLTGVQQVFVSGKPAMPDKMMFWFLVYVGFLLLPGSIYLIRTIGKIKIHARKFFISFFWLFITSLLAYFLVPSTGIEMITFAAIPVSYLLGYYFAFCKPNRINNLILMVLLAGIAVLRILG